MTTLSLVIVERLESFEIAWVQSMHFGSQSPSQRPNDLGFLLRGTQFSWGFIVPRIIFHWTISREKRSMKQAACLMDWTVTHFTNFAFFPASEITQNFVIPPTETHAYNKALQGLNKKINQLLAMAKKQTWKMRSTNIRTHQSTGWSSGLNGRKSSWDYFIRVAKIELS